jgi:hypothetical protein
VFRSLYHRESNLPVETGAAMAKAAMERTVATMVVNFMLAIVLFVCLLVEKDV